MVMSDTLRQFSQQHPRYGYRRVGALLRRSGRLTNHKRVYRLWRQAGLSLPRKRAYRRRYGGKHRWMSAIRPNAIWAYDFVFDECANGQKLKCLTVVDEYTRECLAIDVGGRLRSGRVIEVLGRLVTLHGAPAFLRSDNGPEFIAKALKRWLENQGITTTYIEPGRPWQNGVAESFNSKFRDEFLNMEYFYNRCEARVLIEEWRQQYNEYRPHSALGYQTPLERRLLSQSSLQKTQQPLEGSLVA